MPRRKKGRHQSTSQPLLYQQNESLGFAMTEGYRSKPQLLSPLRWAIYLINLVDKNENFARLQFEGHLLLRSLADDTVDTEKIWIRD